MTHLQAGQVQVEAQVIQAAADVAGLTVPSRQAAGVVVRLAAGAEQRGEAAAAVLQGLLWARCNIALAQALLQPIRL